MELQRKMFSEVESWMVSGESKSRFLEHKTYTEAKFNYWLAKWKAKEQLTSGGEFCEVSFSELNASKVMEIQMSSGVKITFF